MGVAGGPEGRWQWLRAKQPILNAWDREKSRERDRLVGRSSAGQRDVARGRGSTAEGDGMVGVGLGEGRGREERKRV